MSKMTATDGEMIHKRNLRANVIRGNKHRVRVHNLAELSGCSNYAEQPQATEHLPHFETEALGTSAGLVGQAVECGAGAPLRILQLNRLSHMYVPSPARTSRG